MIHRVTQPQPTSIAHSKNIEFILIASLLVNQPSSQVHPQQQTRRRRCRRREKSMSKQKPGESFSATQYGVMFDCGLPERHSGFRARSQIV